MGKLYTDSFHSNSELNSLGAVQDWFGEWCEHHSQFLPWLVPQVYPLSLALSEGFTNVLKHAHPQLCPDTPIEVFVRADHCHLHLEIWDRGEAFDPDLLKVFDPTAELGDPAGLATGGYGWFLMKRLSDELRYERREQGGRVLNCLTLVKYAPHTAHHSSSSHQRSSQWRAPESLQVEPEEGSAGTADAQGHHRQILQGGKKATAIAPHWRSQAI